MSFHFYESTPTACSKEWSNISLWLSQLLRIQLCEGNAGWTITNIATPATTSVRVLETGDIIMHAAYMYISEQVLSHP